MKKQVFPVLLCLLCLFFKAQAQKNVYSAVRITVNAAAEKLLPVIGIEADHAGRDEENGFIYTVVSASDLKKMDKAGITYKIQARDAAAEFLQRNDPRDFYKYDDRAGSASNGMDNALIFNSPSQAFASTITTPAAFTSGSMGGYLTLAEMKTKLDNMKASYPALVKIDTIGYTYQGRPIWCVKISDNVAADETTEPEAFYSGLHHAREPMSMHNLIFFMQYLLENYAANARIAEIVNSRQLYFVPCVNPDGYEYNRQTNPSGGGMHRKNRSNTGGSNGVDLNRNYSYGWGYNNTGSSPTPSADTYRGTSAFSELETRAIRDFLRSRRISGALNYHAYGNLLPHSPEVDTATVTASEAKNIADLAALNGRYNCYKAGTPIQTVGYATNGSSGDFFFKGDAALRGNIYNFSPEIGTSTFWPSASQIIPLCKAVFYGNVQMALAAGGYAKTEDASSIAVSTTSGSFSFILQRIGLVNKPVTVSLLPLENIASTGAPMVVSSIPAYMGQVNGAVSYSLPAGITNGSRIRFVWQAETDGVTVLDTITKFYNPTMLFADDMETGAVTTKWTVGSSWNYATGGAFAGNRLLTESPSGNYTSSSNRLIICKTILNLSGANNAYISYWIRNRAENGQDRLQMQFATNGNGSSAAFTSRAGVHTITETVGAMGGVPGFTGRQDTWVRELVSLNSLLGNTNVGFRFNFQSGSSVNDDGFYIDNIEIVKANSAGARLITGNLILGGMAVAGGIHLQWKDEADITGGTYIIRRSADGVNFTTLTTMANNGTVYFDDKSPAAGKNLYTLTHVLEDGTVRSGKPITVYVSNALDAAAVTFAGKIVVTANAAENMPVNIQVTDQQGRLIQQVKQSLHTGKNIYEISLNAPGAAGIYYVVIRDQNGNILKVVKAATLH